MIRCSTVESPIGTLTLAGDGGGLAHILFPSEPVPAGWVADPGAHGAARRQLAEWFAGDRTDFDLELAPVGTDFQQHVWAALRAIPYGSTTTYGALAAQLGRPAAARAVGAANGRNPLPIVVPCHRVVGADGALTGFSGGIPLKRFLLAHERRVCAT